MSRAFAYTARTPAGDKKTGKVQAEDSKRVAAILFEQNLVPVSIKAVRATDRPGVFGFLKSRAYEDLIIFTRSLATLYRAGIPILRALSIVRVGDAGSYFNRALGRIREGVQAGHGLAEAMAEYPRIFPRVYLASIEAGEQTGKIDQLLDALVAMIERDLELNRQIKSSIRYPLFVMLAIAAAFIVLITFVIPRFVGFYSEMGSQLPLPTMMLIWLNQFITTHWIFIVGGILAAAVILRYLYASRSGRLFFDRWLLSMPLFGEIIVKGNVARFAYIFEILLKSGITVVKSLELLSEVVKNSRLSREIREMAEAVRSGREFDAAAGQTRFFPEMSLQMIRVGLESGSLETMLHQVAVHYSREVDYKSRHLTSFLEPLLTVVLGFFILVVALAIFLPMWNLIQVFRG